MVQGGDFSEGRKWTRRGYPFKEPFLKMSVLLLDTIKNFPSEKEFVSTGRIQMSHSSS